MDGFTLGVGYYNQVNGTQVEVLGWDVNKHDGLFTGNFVFIHADFVLLYIWLTVLSV
jgi:hypothetical protein